MIIKTISYKTIFSKNEDLLFNVGKTVSVYNISDNNATILTRIKTLSNPLHIVLSSDEKIFAFSNTSGHIAVHDANSFELIAKSKFCDMENGNIFFINNDSQILSRNFGNQAIVFDIDTQKTETIYEFPITLFNIVPLAHKSHFIVYGSTSEEDVKKTKISTRMFELFINEQCRVEELPQNSEYRLNEFCAISTSEGVYFYGRILNSREDGIYFYNSSTKEMKLCFNISKVMNISDKEMMIKHGYYITSMCLSNNKKYLLIGFSKSVVLFDMENYKYIKTIMVDYVSCVGFLANDTKIFIGTWEHIIIDNFII